MEESVSPSIPSAMRPSKSLVAHVRNTLSNLVSSVFKKSSVVKKSVNEKGDANVDNDGDNEAPAAFEGSPESKDSTCNGGGKATSDTIATPPISKSQLLRTRDAFKERLKSFKLSWWCGKPLSLSPPLLAQYGWECVGENIAKCCVCGSVIAIHLPWPNSTNYHVVCREAQQKIMKGHKRICSWPNNPASESYLNPFNEEYLSPEDKDRLKTEFVARAIRLHEIQSGLPHITLEILSEMNLDESSLSKLTKLCGFQSPTSSCNEEENISEHATQLSSVALALCGWDTNFNTLLASLQCDDTGRTVGLWNFYSVSPGEDESVSSPAKRRKVDTDRESSLSDTSAGPVKSNTKPGWKVLRDILLDSETPNEDETSTKRSPKKVKTPPRVAVMQARRMLKDWSPRE